MCINYTTINRGSVYTNECYTRRNRKYSFNIYRIIRNYAFITFLQYAIT